MSRTPITARFRPGLPLAACLLATYPVRAEPDTVDVRLEVAADPACATQAEVRDKIGVRSDRIRFVDLETAKVVRAAFEERRAEGVTARLTVVQPNGKAATRELRARSCVEAIDALALVAAVTLDPLANTEPVPAEDTGAARAEPAPSDPVPRTPAEPPRASTAVTPVGDEADSSAQGAVRDARGTSVSFGAVAASIWGPAPSVMPGFGVYVELASNEISAWSPSLRATVSRRWRAGFESRYGTAGFALTEAAVELCPIALRASGFALRPCGMITAGWLDASGSNTEAARDRVRPWSVAGASLRATARATDRLEFSAGVGAGYPLVRDRFEFEPEVFHEVPGLAFSAVIGAGLRFP